MFPAATTYVTPAFIEAKIAESNVPFLLPKDILLVSFQGNFDYLTTEGTFLLVYSFVIHSIALITVFMAPPPEHPETLFYLQNIRELSQPSLLSDLLFLQLHTFSLQLLLPF